MTKNMTFLVPNFVNFSTQIENDTNPLLVENVKKFASNVLQTSMIDFRQQVLKLLELIAHKNIHKRSNSLTQHKSDKSINFPINLIFPIHDNKNHQACKQIILRNDSSYKKCTSKQIKSVSATDIQSDKQNNLQIKISCDTKSRFLRAYLNFLWALSL